MTLARQAESPLDRSYVRQNVGMCQRTWASKPAARLGSRASLISTLFGTRHLLAKGDTGRGEHVQSGGLEAYPTACFHPPFVDEQDSDIPCRLAAFRRAATVQMTGYSAS